MTLKMQDGKFTLVKLSDISIHTLYNKINEEAYSEYLLKNSADFFTEKGINFILTVNPIFLIKKGNNYFCISGIRSYIIAIENLDKKSKIPVFLFSKRKQESYISDCIIADIFLSKLIHTIYPKSARYFGKIFDEYILNEYSDNNTFFTSIQSLLNEFSKQSISKALNAPRNSIFIENEREIE